MNTSTDYSFSVYDITSRENVVALFWIYAFSSLQLLRPYFPGGGNVVQKFVTQTETDTGSTEQNRLYNEVTLAENLADIEGHAKPNFAIKAI